MKSIIAACLLVFAMSSCEKEDDNASCQDTPSLRRGAMCNDGTTSTATGSGACSGHGGVDYWLCQ